MNRHRLMGWSISLLLLFEAVAHAAPPVVCGFEPNWAHIYGGDSVRLVGNLGGNWANTRVYFGSAPAAHVHYAWGGSGDYTECPDEHAVIDMPLHPPGVVDVRVVTAGGEVLLEQAFTFVPNPIISDVTPPSASTVGRDYVRVVISGLQTDPPPKVYLGGKEVNAVAIEGEVSFMTPPSPAGETQLLVVNDDGTQASTTFLFEPYQVTAPRLFVLPDNPRPRVRIHGSGLNPMTMTVAFDGVPGALDPIWHPNSTREVYALTPGGGFAEGAELVLTNRVGDRVSIPDYLRSIDEVPGALPLNVNTLSVNGGEVLGFYQFTPLTGILFGGVPAIQMWQEKWSGYNSYTYSCIVPPHPPGSVVVTLIPEYGEPYSAEGNFAYVERPANDTIEDAYPIAPDDAVTGDLGAASFTGGLHRTECGDGGKDVFFRMDPVAAGTVRALLCAESRYQHLDVYDAERAPIACARNHCLHGQSTIDPKPAEFAVLPGETYYLRVANSRWNDSTSSFGLTTTFYPSETVEVDGEETPEGDAQEGAAERSHDADLNDDFRISLSEALRVIQFHNAAAYHCADNTEDGYAPGAGEGADCQTHAADYDDELWSIGISEVVKLIQLYNAGGYRFCDSQPEKFCTPEP